MTNFNSALVEDCDFVDNYVSSVVEVRSMCAIAALQMDAGVLETFCPLFPDGVEYATPIFSYCANHRVGNVSCPAGIWWGWSHFCKRREVAYQ